MHESQEGLMARARQIKPTFFMHEVVATLSAFTRLYWIGLWTLADREGRLEYRPMRIKAQLFPYEAADIEASTSELESKGFVQRRKSQDGRVVLYIVNWHKHQKPHQNEANSEFPPLEEGLEPLDEALALEPRTLNLEPRTQNLESGTQDPPRKRAAPKKEATPDEILGGRDTPLALAFWKLSATFGPGKNKQPRETAKAYLEATKATPPEDLQRAADTLRTQRKEQVYMPQLQPWLENHEYSHDLTPQGAPNGSRSPHHRAEADAAWARQFKERKDREPQQMAGTGAEALF